MILNSPFLITPIDTKQQANPQREVNLNKKITKNATEPAGQVSKGKTGLDVKA